MQAKIDGKDSEVKLPTRYLWIVALYALFGFVCMFGCSPASLAGASALGTGVLGGLPPKQVQHQTYVTPFATGGIAPRTEDRLNLLSRELERLRREVEEYQEGLPDEIERQMVIVSSDDNAVLERELRAVRRRVDDLEDDLPGMIEDEYQRRDMREDIEELRNQSYVPSESGLKLFGGRR